MEAAVVTRIYAISDPQEVSDPRYLHGLHTALAAALDYAFAALEGGGSHAPQLPPALLAQARLAARDRVPLDTVLRRCFAGNALLGDFLVEEAELAEVGSSELRRLMATQALGFDRLVTTVSREYASEAKSRPSSAAERRRECVKSLLAGELVDYSGLGYELEAHHVALMVKGEEADKLLRELSAKLDRRLLAVCREEEPVWACWLGGRQPLTPEKVVEALRESPRQSVVAAIGEPGEGLGGWRFSHRQAKAALPIAERSGKSVVRYADVALLASILRDDLVITSLRRLYLAPLEEARDGGEAARQTLQAFFAAERNVSSTAAALGIDRRTVRNRIHAIEERLGCTLESVAVDLQLALKLDD